MSSNFKITIPKPCHENWDAMSPDEQGRFCGVCAKSVIDFTKMNDTQVKTFFSENSDKKICGRFRMEQVKQKIIFNVPLSVFNKKRSFQKSFLLVLFVVMGTTLFSCKNSSGKTVGEVAVVEGTTASNITMGMPIPPKDTIQSQPLIQKKEDKHTKVQKVLNEKEDKVELLGKVDSRFISNDSIQIPENK